MSQAGIAEAGISRFLFHDVVIALPLELHDFVWEALSNGGTRLPNESLTHTQRSATPNPVSIQTELLGFSGITSTF